VATALRQVGFRPEKLEARGGLYAWARPRQPELVTSAPGAQVSLVHAGVPSLVLETTHGRRAAFVGKRMDGAPAPRSRSNGTRYVRVNRGRVVACLVALARELGIDAGVSSVTLLTR